MNRLARQQASVPSRGKGGSGCVRCDAGADLDAAVRMLTVGFNAQGKDSGAVLLWRRVALRSRNEGGGGLVASG